MRKTNAFDRTSLGFVAALLSFGAVTAAAQGGTSQPCGTDSATVRYVRDRLLNTVPGKSDSTTVRLSANADECGRARAGFPVERGNLDVPYVFTVSGAPPVRYGVVRSGPEYPREIVWQWVVCFFDQTWDRVGSCVPLEGQQERVDRSCPRSPVRQFAACGSVAGAGRCGNAAPMSTMRSLPASRVIRQTATGPQ